MRAWVSTSALSKTHWHFSLAIAGSEHWATTLCLIAALCFSSSAYVQGQSNATEPLPVVGMNDSLRIPGNEIPILRDRARNGDRDAAERLSLYYSFFVENKAKERYYLELAAKNGSEVALKSLITIYSSTDPDRFDLKRAFISRRRLKKMAQEQKIEIKPDADWAYDLYMDHFVGAGNKRRGLFFLEYAAKHGSEKARYELIEVYSNDPDVENPEKARYWKQRSDAANSMPVRTLALVSNATGQSPDQVERIGVANATNRRQPIQFLLSVSQERPDSGLLALRLILLNTSRVLQDLSKTGKISVTCKIGTPTLYVPGQYVGITRSLEPEIAAQKLKPGKWVTQEIQLQPELGAEEIAEISATCEVAGTNRRQMVH